MMKQYSHWLLVATSCLTTQAHAIDFWHSGTVWAGQGQCSAEFSFDSGMDDINNLEVSVTAFNKIGKKVAANVLRISKFGQSSENRYANAFLEGEEICDKDLVIVINKATAKIDGKQIDLLASKKISVRNFQPFKIRLKGNLANHANSSCSPHGVDVCELARKLADKISTDLPKKLSDNMALTTVLPKNNTITATAVLNYDRKLLDKRLSESAINNETIYISLRNIATSAVCQKASPMSDFIKQGGVISYVYRFSDGAIYKEIQINSC